MEATLAIIGIDYRTSPLAVRERFWMNETRRLEALQQLVRCEGIEEVVVLATCNRAEFLLWASDVPTAANSVLRFLTQDYQIKLCEWSHFFRLMDEAAITHVFRVASGLEAMVLGQPEIALQLKQAWTQAQEAGTTGRFLDTVMQRALGVSKRAHTETAIGSSAVSLPYAAVELSKSVLGELDGREVLLVGAGRMGELAAHYLSHAGAQNLKIMNRTPRPAEELARKVGATAVPFSSLQKHLATADVVVSATASTDYLISPEQGETAARARNYRPMVIIDIAVPRNIDPEVVQAQGIHLFDMDNLESVLRRKTLGRQAAAEAAGRIVQEEAQAFRCKLIAERVVPTIVALRERIDELCRQELEVLRKELGPFTEDQDEALTTLTAHITQRIAGSLARELKELPDREEQDVLTTAVSRLFQLKRPAAALVEKN